MTPRSAPQCSQRLVVGIPRPHDRQLLSWFTPPQTPAHSNWNSVSLLYGDTLTNHRDVGFVKTTRRTTPQPHDGTQEQILEQHSNTNPYMEDNDEDSQTLSHVSHSKTIHTLRNACITQPVTMG
eukprot:4194976-Amphidinium_carterae.1